MQAYINEFNKLGLDGSLIVEELKKEGIISRPKEKKPDKPFVMDFSIISVNKSDFPARATSVSEKNVKYNLADM